MAILYGTTSEGESLPVEVNEFGQLVAEGLTGQQGPPGPPGLPELPPDPFEGAILGWQDNTLAWLGGSVPLPPGTFGPIISYADGVLTMADDVNLLNGQSVFLSDAAGDAFYYQPTAQVVSVSGDVYTVNTDFDMWQVGDSIGSGALFSTTLYDGNQSTQTITTGIDLASQPGLIWLKATNGTENHFLTDTVRGTNAQLKSNTNTGEAAGDNYITSFLSDGFTLGNTANVNQTGKDYVSWNFRAAPKFFDVVYYLGSSSPQSIPHNLGSKPGFTIVKCTNYSSDWRSYHGALGATKYLGLNSTVAADTATSVWNDTEPTSTEFTVGTSTTVNGVDRGFIAYLFADEPGLIKCSSINHTTTENTVEDCGFRPGWLMIKNTTTTSSWIIKDDKRGDVWLFANSTEIDPTSYSGLQFTDTGFTVQSGLFQAGQWIYVAIAEDGSDLSFVQALDEEASTLTISNGSFVAGDLISSSVKSGAGSVLQSINDSIILRSDNTQWLPGQYVTAPSQAVAARKVAAARVRKRYSNGV